MSKRNTTYFNEKWFDEPRVSSWIERCPSNRSEKCRLCCKVIDLSSMGVSSLVSHVSDKSTSKQFQVVVRQLH